MVAPSPAHLPQLETSSSGSSLLPFSFSLLTAFTGLEDLLRLGLPESLGNSRLTPRTEDCHVLMLVSVKRSESVVCPSVKYVRAYGVSQSVLLAPPAVFPGGLRTEGSLQQLQHQGGHAVVQQVGHLEEG